MRGSRIGAGPSPTPHATGWRSGLYRATGRNSAPTSRRAQSFVSSFRAEFLTKTIGAPVHCDRGLQSCCAAPGTALGAENRKLEHGIAFATAYRIEFQVNQ